MKQGFVSALHACILLFILARPALADTSLSYPDLFIDDVRHVLTAPARWEKPEWQNFGLASLAVVGTAAIIDRPLRDAMRRQSGNSNFMREVERFGAEYSLGVLGGFYLAGKVGGNDQALAVAEDGLTASLIASGIVTPALKFAVGRSRPRDNSGIADFKPFSYANSSFPSGHTTEAFTLASVIARHYDETWVDCVSYTTAGLVGVARSYHDAHFASDVLAGALIGTWVGKNVVEHNRQRRAGTVALVPEAGPGRIGVRLTGNL